MMSDGKWRPEKLIVIVREVVSGDGDHNLLLLLDILLIFDTCVAFSNVLNDIVIEIIHL